MTVASVDSIYIILVFVWYRPSWRHLCASGVDSSSTEIRRADDI